MFSLFSRPFLFLIFFTWLGNCSSYGEVLSGSGGLPRSKGKGSTNTHERTSVTCKNDPCGLNGFCVQLPQGFVCVCDDGWTGYTCNEQAEATTSYVAQDSLDTACQVHPCSNNCSCVDSCQHEFGRICVSEEGFIGDSCTIEVPVVTCGPSTISVAILPEFYREFDRGSFNSFIYVSSDENGSDKENCQASLIDGKYIVLMQLPFDSCGMLTYKREGYIVFENRMWINRILGDHMDMPVPFVDFQCIYAQEYSVVSSLQPVVGHAQSVEMGTAEIGFRLELCKAEVCPAMSCPSSYSVNDGALYTIGEKVHVGIYDVSNRTESTNQFDFIPTVQELYISCSSNSSLPALAQLVSNGCPSSPGFYLSVNSGNQFSSKAACITFQVPRILVCSSIYVHAYVRLCLANELQSCPNSPSTKRCGKNLKRSIDQSDPLEDSNMEVIGPIRFIEGSYGQSQISIDADELTVEIYRSHFVKDRDDVTLEGREETTDLIFFLVFGALGLLAVSTLLVVYYKFTTAQQRRHVALLNGVPLKY